MDLLGSFFPSQQLEQRDESRGSQLSFLLTRRLQEPGTELWQVSGIPDKTQAHFQFAQ